MSPIMQTRRLPNARIRCLPASAWMGGAAAQGELLAERRSYRRESRRTRAQLQSAKRDGRSRKKNTRTRSNAEGVVLAIRRQVPLFKTCMRKLRCSGLPCPASSQPVHPRCPSALLPTAFGRRNRGMAADAPARSRRALASGNWATTKSSYAPTRKGSGVSVSGATLHCSGVLPFYAGVFVSMLNSDSVPLRSVARSTAKQVRIIGIAGINVDLFLRLPAGVPARLDAELRERGIGAIHIVIAGIIVLGLATL